MVTKSAPYAFIFCTDLDACHGNVHAKFQVPSCSVTKDIGKRVNSPSPQKTNSPSPQVSHYRKYVTTSPGGNSPSPCSHNSPSPNSNSPSPEVQTPPVLDAWDTFWARMQGYSHYAWVFCTAVGAYARQVLRCFLHMGASTALDPRLGNGGVTWIKPWVEGQAWGILPWRGTGQIVKLPQSTETPPVQILAVAG